MSTVSSLRAELAQQVSDNRWVWFVAAAFTAVAMTMASDPALVWRTFGDTDDATRLIQVRALLDGAGWYNTTLPQIGLPEALTSHWSRLVDVPLAGLLWFGGLFFDDRTADTIVRAIWPVLFLIAMMAIAGTEAERRGGPMAGAICLFLAATSGYATFQFMPGRIDHHNIQILGAAGGMLLVFRALATGRGGRLAGALLGFAIAVGYEAMPLIMALLGLGVLIAAFETKLLRPMADILISMAVVMAMAWAITVPPWQWLNAACDALSLNLVALTVIGAA
ncbi:MAG: hypothetical protein AAFV54_14550, partial [Pseudomonadota bacterium]